MATVARSPALLLVWTARPPARLRFPAPQLRIDVAGGACGVYTLLLAASRTSQSLGDALIGQCAASGRCRWHACTQADPDADYTPATT